MKTGLKKGLVLGLSACMAMTSLAGCSSKEKGLDASAVALTVDGQNTDAGVLNLMLRYQQTMFESSYGAWLKSYYGEDIWNADLTGSGEVYGETFKNDVVTNLEKMLLAEQHMADYSVELTDADKTAISEAAQKFLNSNDEAVLNKMTATNETVERLLTLLTIQNKMEASMSADVDTEVSDEEAAQRTVSYVRFEAIDPEQETEAETESVSEAGSEAASEAGTDGAAETAAEEMTETATEAEKTSEAAVTEVTTDKTGAADTEAETETAAETEKTTEAATEAGTEAATEAVTEQGSEAVTEAETETETEDPAMAAAKEEAKQRAEAFLKKAETAEDFDTLAQETADADDHAFKSSYTFGKDDTYPDPAIIQATEGLDDQTLADQVIEVGDNYYVVYVTDAFDEDATANKKDEIVNQRKSDAISALYDEWLAAAEITVNEDILAEIKFDVSLTQETEAATEAVSESGTESASEAATEAVSEAETEAVSETEAASEEKEKQTETETEAATEAATEAVSEAETK